jgi:hypothetical protein
MAYNPNQYAGAAPQGFTQQQIQAPAQDIARSWTRNRNMLAGGIPALAQASEDWRQGQGTNPITGQRQQGYAATARPMNAQEREVINQAREFSNVGRPSSSPFFSNYGQTWSGTIMGSPADREQRFYDYMRTGQGMRELGWGPSIPEQQRQATQDAFTASELQRRENVRNELYGTARGREQELRDDPLNAAIRQRLQERIGGGGPFDDATRNAMLAQQAEMGDAAMAAQMRQMGGRPGDPAFEAQRRGLDLQRAQGMQGAARNIDMQRSLTNYNAMGQDLGQAASINQAQQAQVTDAQRFLQSLLGSEQFNAGMPAREISFDDYMRARSMMG